jgi:hypothetical protein
MGVRILFWSPQSSVFQMLQQQRSTLQHPFFMEVFMIATWCIWNERNAKIFNNKLPSVATWKQSLANEVKLHLYRTNASFHPSIMDWLNLL